MQIKRSRAGSAAAITVLILVLIFGAVILVLYPNLLQRIFVPGGSPGQPQQDPITKKYTVYILVSGHRDWTSIPTTYHANIHIDSITYYYDTPPAQPPSGQTFADFDKNIRVTVTVSGPSITTMTTTFDAMVSLGAQWGKVVWYTLPSGTYNIMAQGVDKDGFQSSASAQIYLP